MYLVALQEWGLTPEYINRRWTEELLGLMFKKRAEQLERENEKLEEAKGGKPKGKHVMKSNADFFATHGIKVTKHV